MFFPRYLPLFFACHPHSKNQDATSHFERGALIALLLIVMLLPWIVPA
jgi:hypothetical protein